MRLTLTEATLQEAVRRLAHFAPTVDTKLLLDPADLVVQTALVYEQPGHPFTVVALQKTLNKSFSLQFDTDEIVGSLRRLGGAGKVSYQPEQDTWTASPTFVAESVSTLQQRQTAEEQVYSNWLAHIDTAWTGFPATERTLLCEDLKRFVSKVFLRHGAECIALVQGSTADLERFVDSLGPTLQEILPKRSPQTTTIMLQEFPAFFAKAPADRKRYLAELLDSAFALYMVGVDNVQSTLIRQALSTVTLYLDTNCIHHLYGLHGSSPRTSARTLVSVSKEFGVHLVVSKRTLEELRASLDKAERSLRSSSAIPRDLASAGAEHSRREDFLTAYWREYGSTGISVEDFLEPYRHPEELLRSEGIEVVNIPLDSMTLAKLLRPEVEILNSTIGNQKSKDVAEHDAIHRILIRHLRDGKSETYIDTKYWFLTVDSSLQRYDLVARQKQKIKNEVPFCIKPNQWLQLIRPLKPRTSDWDETFVDLLASPYLRPYQALPPDLAFKILARISMYKDHSPELAVKALTNTYLTHRLRKARSEDEEIALIDSAAAQAAEEFRLERDELRHLLEVKEAEMQEVVVESDSLTDDLARVGARNNSLEGEVETLNDTISGLAVSLATEQSRRERNTIVIRWLIALGVWGLGGVVTWKLLTVSSGLLPIDPQIAATLLGLAVGIGGFWIPLGFGRSWKVIAAIGVVLGILSAVRNLAR